MKRRSARAGVSAENSDPPRRKREELQFVEAMDEEIASKPQQARKPLGVIDQNAFANAKDKSSTSNKKTNYPPPPPVEEEDETKVKAIGTKRLRAPLPSAVATAAAASSSHGLSSSRVLVLAEFPAELPRWSSSSLSPGSTVPAGVDDIDKRRKGDPSYVSTYARDAYVFLSDLQKRDGPSRCPFNPPRSDGLRASMRGTLVDWIVEVLDEFNTSSDVLHLAVATVDRALKKLTLDPNHMQLLACAAMLLSAKFEDVYTPTLDEFLSVANNVYTRAQLLDMEHRVLVAIDYRMMTPTGKPFLRRYQRAAAVSVLEKALSNYISELSLPSTFFLKFSPSVIAAASVYFARLLLFELRKKRNQFTPRDSDPVRGSSRHWTPELIFYTGFEEAELAYLVEQFWILLTHAQAHPHLKSVHHKYQQETWSEIATFPFTTELSQAVLPPITEKALREGGK